MIFESKMNVIAECEISKHFENAKSFIFDFAEIGKWHSVENIPSSIVAEVFKMWNEGLVVWNKKIELDETDQYYRIIKV